MEHKPAEHGIVPYVFILGHEKCSLVLWLMCLFRESVIIFGHER